MADYSYINHVDPAQTYFTLVNTTKKVIKKGEQIYLSYGKRSNACLLLNYGFAYADNPYDYAEVRHHIWSFYLKLDMINVRLLASLRSGWEIGHGEILVVT